MDLPPFLLDHWLAAHQFASPPIAYDLAASTGPRWTVSKLLALGADGPDIGGMPIGYAPSEGGRAKWNYHSVQLRDDAEALDHFTRGNWQGVVSRLRADMETYAQ